MAGEFRGGIGMFLLWNALADYVLDHGIEILFGVASFHGTDVAPLAQATGAEVWLKFDNLHFTGSFKERGALNRLLALTPEERKRGVIAMSAGNHAQGVAWAAAALSCALVATQLAGPGAATWTMVRSVRTVTACAANGVVATDADATARTAATSRPASAPA